MASNAGGQPGAGVPWRIVGWGFAVAILLLPFVAMRVGADGVNWSLGDFIVFGVMLGAVGGAFELAVRASGNWAYRGGAALGLFAAFLVVWANLAVGIVGNETQSVEPAVLRGAADRSCRRLHRAVPRHAA